jgi:hydroxymethylpyrimidine pyrophosphatase-like HAD family hydrolase
MSYDQVISFGDGYNDIEMIRDARLGVAMLNAVDDLKKSRKRNYNTRS